MIKKMGLMVFIISVVFYPLTTLAEGMNTTKDSDSSSGLISSIQDMVKKLDEMWQLFQDLMSGKLIKDAVTHFVVSLVDDFISPMLNSFAKNYLFTPRVAEMEFVYKSWMVVTIIGVALLILGIGVLVLNVLRGRQDMKIVLKVFVFCFLALISSLTVINITNVGVNWVVQESLSNMLKTTKINYSGLDGQQIVKSIIVGIQGITDPAFAAKTPGQIIVESEGGLFTLLGVVLFVILPLWLVINIKSLVLVVLAIFVAFWIVAAAYTGKYEIMMGWGNIYLRTLVIGLIIPWHWGSFVQAQSEYGEGKGMLTELGISPTYMAYFSVILLLILFYFLWFRPIMTAVKDPITLGGGKVIETMGERMKQASDVVGGMGKRLGIEELQKVSIDWSKKSSEISDYGRRLQDTPLSYHTSKWASDITFGLSEELQGITYEHPSSDDWYQTTGSIVQSITETLGYQGLHFQGIETKDLTLALRKRGFTPGAILSIRGADKKKLSQMLTPEFSDRFGDAFQWDATTGTMLLTTQVPSILSELENQGISTDQVKSILHHDDVYVDNKTKTISTFGEPEKLDRFIKEFGQEIPVYREAGLPPVEAEQVYNQLTTNRYQYPWADQIKLDNNRLLIPEHLTSVVNQVLQPQLQKKASYVRVDMPKGSRFLASMIQEWKADAVHHSWVHHLQLEGEKNYLFVPQEHVTPFKEAFEAYREKRIPYWITKTGKIKVIQEGIPVDYGSVPLFGLNMGSFEEFQKESLRKHAITIENKE